MKEVSDALVLSLDQPSSARTVKTRTSDGRRRTISPKLKAAIDGMVYQGEPWDAAARAAGLTARMMRKALKRHHIIQYLRAERATFRAALSARNELVVAEIRDASDGNQMARLHAAKYLDGDFVGEAAAGAHGRSVQPGVVVLIRNEVNATPGVDFETLIEINPSHDDAEALS